MTITFKNGDLFEERTEALINTVNCVGVMGKGVAREFKIRWPDNYEQYRLQCDSKLLRPGKLFIYELHQLFPAEKLKYLINFPTKDHWRNKSKIDYVSNGLDALVTAIKDLKITSIAMPPLGCGNGGLDWSDVKPLIIQKMQGLEDVDVVVFNPFGQAEEPEFNTTTLPMTFERALILKLLVDLGGLFDDHYDRLSLQKLIYLLQAMGVNLRLAFNKNLHGPYSEALRKAFISLERYKMVAGFVRSRETTVTAAGYATAEEYLRPTSIHDADEIINRLSRLLEGYESPYGLELLSTVHQLASDYSNSSLNELVKLMSAKNQSEGNIFSEEEIKRAYDRLHEDKLIIGRALSSAI